jgi:tetratricopeptide (TPR) repeat protein
VGVYSNRGVAHSALAQYDQAIADFDAAISVDPRDVSPQRELAWLRATCTRPQYRDAAAAVRIATNACELSAWKDAHSLDTLAAAYAESGNFSQAIHWQAKAIALADRPLKKAFEARLDLYKAGKPYREEPKQRPNR